MPRKVITVFYYGDTNLEHLWLVQGIVSWEIIFVLLSLVQELQLVLA